MGDPVLGLLALVGVRVRLRVEGMHSPGELLALVALCVLNRAVGVRAGSLRGGGGQGEVGRDPHAATLSRAWDLARQGRCEEMAELVDAFAVHCQGPPTLRADFALCQELLRAEQTCAVVGPERMRSRLVRGLAYSVATMGIERMRGYDDYARRTDVDALARTHVLERWAQGLITTGRLPEAIEVLAEPRATATGVPAANLARAASRIWRVAGDAAKAIELNDEAMDHVAGLEAPATMLGNLWLNRGYALLSAGRRADAFAATCLAQEHYARNPFAHVGLDESRALRSSCDPDPAAGASLARLLLAKDKNQGLAKPARAAILHRAAVALIATAPAEALRELLRAVSVQNTATDGVGRMVVLSAIEAARLASTRAPEAAAEGVDALQVARRAYDLAQEQSNRLLRARAGLLLCRVLARSEASRAQVPELARETVDDLGSALAGIAVDAGQRILLDLRDDLFAVFDAAVGLDDGELALRLAETGRAVRLMALLRLRPEEMPQQVRMQFAALSAAERAEEGDLDIGQGPTRETRSAASAQVAEHSEALAQQVGSIFRSLVAEPPVDVRRARALFPSVHLLCLDEKDDVVRWVWWRPGEPVPRAGRQPLTALAATQLATHADGSNDSLPGDTVSGLGALLPDGLRSELLGRPGSDLLIVPGGRLWRVPFAALPVSAGDEGRLSAVARVTVTPSLSMATMVAEQAMAHEPPTGALTVAGYCNPSLPGAETERQALVSYENFVAWDGLDAARAALGGTGGPTFGVLSTHGEPGPGLAQAAVDHSRRRLTAGEALLLSFPGVTALPICFGMNANLHDEPIGLLTVAQARGAVWVVGGYQKLRDRTTGWVLARTYERMRHGTHLVDALRDAQIEYLSLLSASETGAGERLPRELTHMVETLGGVAGARHPRSWAVTVVGPPHPDSWHRGAEEGTA
ncbi:CHAT domain-containing protein [Streptomyces glaucescens]|uniref:CHAT domain-containing protein n=1 Tax=Streptomyces glaucescens TaxID=1907 RepID=UPI00344DE81D